MPEPGTKSKTNGRKTTKPVEEAEIKYPMISVTICGTPEKTGVSDEVAAQVRKALEKIAPNLIGYADPIYAADAMRLLDWESEPDYVKRRMMEDPNLSEKKLKYGEEYLLKDGSIKVRCNNNTKNRPFDEKHARKMCQIVLTKDYELNCETIIITRTGQVISGQHRLIGLILAYIEWKKQPHWQEIWDTEPYIETLIVFGASDDPKVIMTVDNVKPRGLGDVFYTSPVFANKGMDARKDLTSMLANAIKLLWRRMGGATSFVEHMTHSSSIDFFERHKKIEMCVKHIHEENWTRADDDSEDKGGRAISTLGLNPGHAAALCFLMAQSGTTPEDSEIYYGPQSPRTQKQLDFKYWDKALLFWKELAENKKPWTGVLRDAIAALSNADLTQRVTVRELHALLALAWAKFVLGEEFDPERLLDLHPEFEIVDSKRKMVNEPTFGGVDKGTTDDEEEMSGGSSLPTPDEVQASKSQIRQERKEAHEAALADKGKTTTASGSKGGKAVTITADAAKKVVPVVTPRQPATPRVTKTTPKIPEPDPEDYVEFRDDDQTPDFVDDDDLENQEPSDQELEATETPEEAVPVVKNGKPKRTIKKPTVKKKR